MTVLVYDLGGGTFDVTLLRLESGDIRMLATDGDVQLGGHDWDKRLVDHVSEVLDIPGDDIEDAPSFGVNVNTDFIVGMGKAEERVTILLNISKVLGSTDLSAIGAAVASDRETQDQENEGEK